MWIRTPNTVAAGDRRVTEKSSRRLCAVDEQTRHAGEFPGGDGVKRKKGGLEIDPR